jgi:hypothetical protein
MIMNKIMRNVNEQKCPSVGCPKRGWRALCSLLMILGLLLNCDPHVPELPETSDETREAQIAPAVVGAVAAGVGVAVSSAGLGVTHACSKDTDCFFYEECYLSACYERCETPEGWWETEAKGTGCWEKCGEGWSNAGLVGCSKDGKYVPKKHYVRHPKVRKKMRP